MVLCAIPFELFLLLVWSMYELYFGLSINEQTDRLPIH